MMRWVLLPILLVALGYMGLSRASVAAPREGIEGVWDARTYRLAGGSRHPVRGRIFFQDGHWQVLFFVMDASGNPQRGSGEGGTYELVGDQLTFQHELNLSAGEAVSGLPEAPLRMIARRPEQSVPEAARAAVVGEALTLWFPTGNRLHFERAKSGSTQ